MLSPFGYRYVRPQAAFNHDSTWKKKLKKRAIPYGEVEERNPLQPSAPIGYRVDNNWVT